MAILESYDDQALATWMRDEALKKVATQLGTQWLNVDPGVQPFKYAGAITQTMVWYGTVTVPAEATNISKLLLLARAAVWFSVMEETAGDFDFEDAGPVKIDRRQVFLNAQTNYEASWEMYKAWLKDQASSPGGEDPSASGRPRTTSHRVESVW